LRATFCSVPPHRARPVRQPRAAGCIERRHRQTSSRRAGTSTPHRITRRRSRTRASQVARHPCASITRARWRRRAGSPATASSCSRNSPSPSLAGSDDVNVVPAGLSTRAVGHRCQRRRWWRTAPTPSNGDGDVQGCIRPIRGAANTVTISVTGRRAKSRIRDHPPTPTVKRWAS